MLLFGYLLFPPNDAKHNVVGDGTDNTGKAIGIMVAVLVCTATVVYYGYSDWDYFNVPDDLKSTGKFMLGGTFDVEMTHVEGERA